MDYPCHFVHPHLTWASLLQERGSFNDLDVQKKQALANYQEDCDAALTPLFFLLFPVFRPVSLECPEAFGCDGQPINLVFHSPGHHTRTAGCIGQQCETSCFFGLLQSSPVESLCSELET